MPVLRILLPAVLFGCVWVGQTLHAGCARRRTRGLEARRPRGLRAARLSAGGLKAKGQSTLLVPWTGSNVVFLTTPGEYDGRLMARWVRALDGGWALYADLTGRRPEPLKQLEGRATIAAVPDFEFTCGAGCGYLGASGIELAMFYRWNYPALQRNPEAIPHYVFYEMGRNFYTFGDRHSCFTTGFAVFMRYVCMDTLGCHDDDLGTRQVIEQAQGQVKRSGLPFLRMFTNADGLGEEGAAPEECGGRTDSTFGPTGHVRVGDAATVARERWQPLVAPLLPPVAGVSERFREHSRGGRGSSAKLYLAASLAAQRDLSGVFVDDWRLPLSAGARKALAAVDWKQPDLTPSRGRPAGPIGIPGGFPGRAMRVRWPSPAPSACATSGAGGDLESRLHRPRTSPAAASRSKPRFVARRSCRC